MRSILTFILFGLLPLVVHAYEFIALDRQQSANLGIQTSSVKPATAAMGMKLPALVVVPNEQLHIISSQQAGLIKQLLVVEGDIVHAGQELVNIQSSEFLELQRDYLQLLSRFRLSEINYNRAKAGFKDGVISEQIMLSAQSEYEELSASRNLKRETLKLLGITQEAVNELERSKNMVSDFTITSPIDGVVLEQLASAGARIDAATAIYKVGRLDPIWIEIHVPLTVIKNTLVGDSIFVPEYDKKGEIITIGQQIHEADQGILVRAVMDNSDGQLRPGQFVQAQILTSKSSAAGYFEINSNAVVHAGNKTLVFVQMPDGFQPVEVSVISVSGQTAIISGEIVEDSDIAISGTSALKAIMMGMGGEG